jgi:tetratricopeptide (TPR) repeat protein
MQSEHGHPILGKEYFLDHVHPTIEGYRILAVELIQAMIDQGVVQPGADWGEQAIAAVAARVEGRIDRVAHGQALATLARTLLWAGKTEDADRLAQQALAMAGENPEVAVNAVATLTAVYQRQKNQEGAVQLLYSTISKAPGAVELRLKLGEALINPPFQRLEEAAANLLLVCQQMPDYDVAHQLFGLAMARRGSLGIAYANLQEALRLNPKNIQARKVLVQIQPLLGGRNPNPRLPDISLDIYPSMAPRKLVQLRREASGRAVPDGIEVEFYENGRLKYFVDIDQGVPNGFEVRWDADGREISRVVYQQGIPVKGELAK